MGLAVVASCLEGCPMSSERGVAGVPVRGRPTPCQRLAFCWSTGFDGSMGLDDGASRPEGDETVGLEIACMCVCVNPRLGRFAFRNTSFATTRVPGANKVTSVVNSRIYYLSLIHI